jgi:D-alanyl-lipoteichoic acid acyltransferase DltB (MBOAT superfamily)
MFTPAAWPRWVFMLSWRRTPARGVKWWQHVGYLLAWPGLNAAAFLGSGRLPQSDRPSVLEWFLALVRLLVGVVLFAVVADRIFARHEIVSGWVGMIGLILMLHFGSFHLLSCAWRSIGVDAQPIMKHPLTATSLSEFWSRKWNTAFRDFTYRFLFRPLNKWCGPRWAILVGFVFSGVIHDLVISVPAGGGYGGPTIFFGVQAVGMFVERSRAGRAVGLTHGWRGWLFTMIALILPAYGLFHPPFVRNIILPFMRSLGAIH